MNPGSRYVQLLKPQRQNLNNGTVYGGLAHALTEGMRGYAARKADEEQKQAAAQREQALTDVLAGMNGGSLTSEGPTQDAAGNARFSNPGRLARLLGDPQTAPFAMRMVEDALKPAPERKMAKDVNGLNRWVDTGEQVFAGVTPTNTQKPTAAMLEYGLAKEQGYEGTFQQYQTDMKRAGASSVNTTVSTGDTGPQVGTIPQGYMLSPVEDGGRVVGYTMAPVPGGPAAREIEGEDKAAEVREAQKEQQSNVVTADIDRILGTVEGADIPVTGMGSFLSRIPGTAARDVAALLETVKANVGFNQLNQMRESSPTGGALGQVTEKELRFLQSVAGSLEQSQSQEQFVRNLNRLKEAFSYVVDRSNTVPFEEIASDTPKQAEAIDYGAASIEQLRALDADAMKKMTDEELAAAARRWEELNGAQ